MAASNVSMIVRFLFVAAVVTCAPQPEAVAQSQMQGVFVGGARPPGGGSSQPNKQATRKECAAQGKQKGLKGRELRAFLKDCIEGTSPTPPAADFTPPSAPKTVPEPSAQPATK